MGNDSVRIVASGSSGNFCVLRDTVAVDMGVPYSAVKPYVDGIKLLLLTHSHSDHFRGSTIKRLAMEKPLLKIGCGPFLVDNLLELGVRNSQIAVMMPRTIYDCGICRVIPEALFHDVRNYGYKIHFPDEKIFYATDTRSLKGISAKGYDWYLVEANFKRDELIARMDEKEEAGEYAYEQRVLKNHLSEEKCNKWLAENMSDRSQYIYLHRHKEK